MAIIQAFFDDSCIGQSPVYCLAGVFARADVWEEFSDNWHAVLEANPRVDFWKTSSAMSFTGEFHRWHSRDRNNKLNALVYLLNDIRVSKIACTVRHSDFVEIYGGHRPYTFLLPLITRELAGMLADLGINEPIDLIFDSQPEHVSEVNSSWQEYYDTAPGHYKSMLARTPIFRDEKEVIPIQAADLFAWYVRRDICKKFFGGAPAPDMPDIDMRTVAHIHATRGDLKNFMDYSLGVELGKLVVKHLNDQDGQNGPS